MIYFQITNLRKIIIHFFKLPTAWGLIIFCFFLNLKQRMVERVLDRVENIFDYVFPIAIGRDFEANTAYGQQARQNMREIQGRVTSDPIFLKDYQQVAEKVVQEYRIVDRDNPMRRKKRTFISENKPVVEFLKNVYPSMERYGRRKKQNPFKRWT